MSTQKFVDRVASYFLARPGEWIDGRELASIGGNYAWRSRVSDCRRELGMDIQNRLRRVKASDGSRFTISEYRFVRSKVKSDVSEYRQQPELF